MDFLTETKKIKYSPETSKNFNHEKNICALFYETLLGQKVKFSKSL